MSLLKNTSIVTIVGLKFQVNNRCLGNVEIDKRKPGNSVGKKVKSKAGSE